MTNTNLAYKKISDLIRLNNEKELKAFEKSKTLQEEKEAISFDPEKEKLRSTNNLSNNLTFKKISQNLKKIFTEEEMKELDRRFLLYSSDGIMSNRQFWNFLDIPQIANTNFAKMFYKAACDFNDNNKLDHINFMDRYKFYQFIAIFSKTSEINKVKHLFMDNNELDYKDEDELNSFSSEVKLKFLCSLFEADKNEEIGRTSFRNFIAAFIEMIFSTKFENSFLQQQLTDLINVDISGNNLVQLLDKIIDLYVDEVFAKSFNGKSLTFDEWKKWLEDDILGIKDILKFSCQIVNNSVNNKK